MCFVVAVSTNMCNVFHRVSVIFVGGGIVFMWKSGKFRSEQSQKVKVKLVRPLNI